MTASTSGGNRSFAFGMQQIAQRLGFGGQALHFAFGGFQRLARVALRRASASSRTRRALRQRRARGCRAARARCSVALSARWTSGASMRAFHRRVQTRLGFAKLLAAGLGKRRARLRGARSWLALLRVPFGEFGGQAFQQAFGFRQRFVAVRRRALRRRQYRRRRCADGSFEFGVSLARACQRAVGVMVERLFALDVLLGLGDAAGAGAGRFAGARFLGVELLRAATIRR